MRNNETNGNDLKLIASESHTHYLLVFMFTLTLFLSIDSSYSKMQFWRGFLIKILHIILQRAQILISGLISVPKKQLMSWGSHVISWYAFSWAVQLIIIHYYYYNYLYIFTSYGRLGNRGSFPAKGNLFSLLHSASTGPGVRLASDSKVIGAWNW
jgi:hypothetical protein